MLEFFKRYCHVVGLVLLSCTVIFGIVRFDGSWYRFFSMVLTQLWFGQAVYNYLRDGWVTIGPGGQSPSADPVWRAGVAVFALFVYVTIFFLF
jgi:hypothetical protein